MSASRAAEFLKQLLDSGANCIGEIFVRRVIDAGFALSHRDDRERNELETFCAARHAREIARFDDAGGYRPLKTAPNLRHGWRLLLKNENELANALEQFYPARLAAFEALRADDLRTTPLRETLERQSGMYRIAAQSSDLQLDQLVGSFCASTGGCLRTILWKRDASGATPSTLLAAEKFDPAYDQTGRGENAIPLLCQEACNLLVAAARERVKSG